MNEKRQKLQRKPKAKIHLPECWVEIEMIPVRALPRVGEQYQVNNIPKLQAGGGPYNGSECGTLLSEEEILVKDLTIWDNDEKGKFETGILHFSKDFTKIQGMIRTKNLSQIIDYYYRWKHTAEYTTFIKNNSSINLDVNHVNINNIDEHFINPTLWNQFILSYNVDPIPTFNYSAPSRLDPVCFDVSVNAAIDKSKVRAYEEAEEVSLASPRFHLPTYSRIMTTSNPDVGSQNPAGPYSPDITIVPPTNLPPKRKQTARRTNPKRRAQRSYPFGYLDSTANFAPLASPLDVVPATPSPQLHSPGLDEQYIFFMENCGDEASDEASDEDYIDRSRSRKSKFVDMGWTNNEYAELRQDE